MVKWLMKLVGILFAPIKKLEGQHEQTPSLLRYLLTLLIMGIVTFSGEWSRKNGLTSRGI